MALININFNPGCEQKKFGDVFSNYAESDSTDNNLLALNFNELNNAIEENMSVRIGTSWFGTDLSSEDSTGTIWNLINSDDDNMHITTDEIDKFLKDTDFTYDDLAQMEMEEAVNLLLEVGMDQLGF